MHWPATAAVFSGLHPSGRE